MDLPTRSWLAAAAARRVVRRVAAAQRGVASRRQLLALGVPRWYIRVELSSGRWQSAGRQALVLHNGPIDGATRRAAALVEAGPRAALAGVSALQEAGLTIKEPTVHVIVPRGARPRSRRRGGRRRQRRPQGARIHESRRFSEQDVTTDGGLRRVLPAAAAVQAALWARSERQAQLFVLMAAQRKLVTVETLAAAIEVVRRHPRRRLLLRVLDDIAGGVESMGELDVAADFRRRGFPEPDRQVLRKRPSGRQYLDVRLGKYALVFELDGASHDEAEARLDDVVRDLDVRADGDTVVRLPLVAYRLDRERVLDGIERLLRSRGWNATAA